MSLHIRTLGPFHAAYDDTPIPDSAWKTQKNKVLFKTLLTYRKRTLIKDQLMEWLWPDLEPDAAGRNLRVAISQLRQALEPDLPRGSQSGFILTTEHGYAWNLRARYWLDAEEFERLALIADSEWQMADSRWQMADSNPATGDQPSANNHQLSAISHLQSAISLYRGDYLEEDRYADWAIAERERLRELYFSLLTRLAEAYARQGRYRRAVAVCREVLAADRCRESIWCQLMLYHYHAGDQALALRAYNECRQVLAEELGVEPMAGTAALAGQIRRRAVAEVRPYPPPAAIERLRQLPLSLGQLPFVGRDREFAELTDHWSAAQAGCGRIVLVEGEAGLGKTRLAQEVLDVVREQGAVILEGKGRELEGALPYQPIVDALRSEPEANQEARIGLDPVWHVELSRLVPEWSLPGTTPPLTGHEPGQLFEALARFLLALAESRAARRGLILCVDDLHWADQTTVEFLAYFGQRLAKHPVLLLATVRPEEVKPHDPLRKCLDELQRTERLYCIRLQPLPVDTITHLIQEMSHGSAIAPKLSHHLYQETQGHPLFMMALLQALFNDGVCHVDEQGRWRCDEDYLRRDNTGLAIPTQVGDLIQRQLQRLDIRVQRLLALAAVIGRPFDFGLIQQASGQDEEVLLDSLEHALERRVLQAVDGPAGRKYDLSHELVRRMAYQSLSSDRRALLHRKVLAALENLQAASDEELAGELAHHALEGRVWARALDYCKRAADVTLGRYALREAFRQCERGLAALEALETSGKRQYLTWRYDLLARKQLAMHLLGQRDEAALDQLVDLAQRTGDRERLAQAYYALMRHYIDTGQNQAALKLVPLYAPVIAQGIAPAAAIGFHQRVGFLYYRAGDLPQALNHHDEALRLAQTVDDADQQAIVLNTRGTVLMCLGRYQDALDDFSQAARLWDAPAKRLHRTFALDNRAEVLYYLGCYADALQVKEEALPLYREFAYPIAEAECLSETGACLRAMGRLAEAETYLRGALALSQSLRDSYDLVQSLNGLALLYLDQDNPAAGQPAAEYASRAVAEAERADLPHGVIQGLAYQALACLRLGQAVEALELSSRAVTLLKARGHIEGAEEEIYFVHSQVLAAIGCAPEAQDALQQAYDELLTKADRLTDPALRRSFLERVRVNCEIQAAVVGHRDQDWPSFDAAPGDVL